MVGARLNHYRILAPLGAGGMGEVYLAEDLKLRRQVALKLLPAEGRWDARRLERLRREALATAALNHPNVVTIHSVEEADGVRFLTMERIEGAPLSKAAPAGGFPSAAMLEVGLQLAEALAAVHEAGLVHRDLKPQNVMVTRDLRLKLVDFGLARSSRNDPALPALTREGDVLGTVAYMSPEQVRGRTTDARSDLFALGVVLYEMAVGRHPFAGGSAAEIAGAILRDRPMALEDLRPDLPPELARIIEACLAKRPEDRPSSARLVATVLARMRSAVARSSERPTRTALPIAPRVRRPGRTIAAAVGAILSIVGVGLGFDMLASERPAERSVAMSATESDDTELTMLAVLPFDNLGAAEDEYFAAGLSEELLHRLTGVSGLGVISRRSTFGYQSTGRGAEEIGRDLGAAFVLDGAVSWQQEPDGSRRVRITPRLVRVADRVTVWGRRFESDLASIFDLQAEIAEELVEQLQLTLDVATTEAPLPTENLRAYQDYLSALYDVQQFSNAEARRRAVEKLEGVVRADPSFAEAWSLLARVCASTYMYGDDHTAANLERLQSAAARSLEIDPGLPEAHLAVGLGEYVERRFEEALENFQRAFELRSGWSEAIAAMAYAHRRLGHWERAAAGLDRAIRLDPRNPTLRTQRAHTSIALRDYAEAVDILDATLDFAPEYWNAHSTKVMALLRDGRLDAARLAVDRLPEATDSLSLGIEIELLDGRYDRALALHDRLEEPRQHIGINRVVPRELVRSWILIGAGREREARALLETVLPEIERLHAEAEDPRGHLTLADIYALLGRRGEALVHAGRAASLMPFERDQLEGVEYWVGLGRVHALLGDEDEALDWLARALSVPSSFSRLELRRHPAFASLRSHPRYRSLAEATSDDSPFFGTGA